MENYRSYGSETWLIKLNAVSSKQWSCRYCYMDAQHGRELNGCRKSLTATTQECCEQFWISPGGNIPQSSSCTATYFPSRKLSKLDEPDMQDTTGEAGTSREPPHMAEQKQLESTYSSSVRIRDVALRTSQKRWTIGRSGERGSGISVLAARRDDDDDIYMYLLNIHIYIMNIYIYNIYICIYYEYIYI